MKTALRLTREKTAFTTGQALSQFKAMKFLCNALATFKHMIKLVLRALAYEACLVYLDNIVIVGNTLKEHLYNILKVIEN